METVIAGQLRLREQVRALRHLRPGTRLPNLNALLAQRLRDDLLRLSDERDPLGWLEEERGETIALLALCSAADLAAGLRRGWRRIERLHADSDVPLFGRLLASGEPPAALASWLEKVSGLAEARPLIETMANLRRECAVPSEESPWLSRVAPGRRTLLADLLRLPERVDTLAWLRSARGGLCARLALEHLVGHSLPLLGLVTGGVAPTGPSRSVRARGRTRGRLWVEVDSIHLDRLGFAIQLRARFSTLRPRPPESHLDSFVTWEGFDRVVDDHGNHYLVQVAERHVVKRPWPWAGQWQERLTLVCWPSLGDARELILQSLPAALAGYYASPFGGELVSLPSPALGSLTICVEVAA